MIHLFVSGPVRPSVQDTLRCLRTLRVQLPPCKVWFSTWETDLPLDDIRAEVDVLIVNREPQDVISFFKGRTRQIRELPHLEAGWVPSIYRMYVGIENIFRVASCDPNDIVIRTRTDLLVNTTPEYMLQLIDRAKHEYVSIGPCRDWFGISTYTTMKAVWLFPTLRALEEHMNASWNAEEMVFRRVGMSGVPLHIVDGAQVDICILRANGFKHYY